MIMKLVFAKENEPRLWIPTARCQKAAYSQHGWMLFTVSHNADLLAYAVILCCERMQRAI